MNQMPSISTMHASKILVLSVLFILSCLRVSGCTTTPKESPPSQTQKALIGKTQKELMSCAGIQPQVKMVGQVTELQYYQEASQFEESFPVSKSSFARAHHGCWAFLRLDNEVVTGVQYRSVPDDALDYDHCDEIFENCVGQ